MILELSLLARSTRHPWPAVQHMAKIWHDPGVVPHRPCELGCRPAGPAVRSERGFEDAVAVAASPRALSGMPSCSPDDLQVQQQEVARFAVVLDGGPQRACNHELAPVSHRQRQICRQGEARSLVARDRGVGLASRRRWQQHPARRASAHAATRCSGLAGRTARRLAMPARRQDPSEIGPTCSAIQALRAPRAARHEVGVIRSRRR